MFQMNFQFVFDQGDKFLIEKFFSGYEKKMSLINLKKEECHPKKVNTQDFVGKEENLKPF